MNLTQLFTSFKYIIPQPVKKNYVFMVYLLMFAHLIISAIFYDHSTINI